eukprot:11673787-Alexandrium_andersonii.AAC.1
MGCYTVRFKLQGVVGQSSGNTLRGRTIKWQHTAWSANQVPECGRRTKWQHAAWSDNQVAPHCVVGHCYNNPD